MTNTPDLTIRVFTNDQYVLDKVFYNNFYRLKVLPENAVVVDVGAHVGYFTVASILKGASKVYSFEALSSNFRYLAKNTEFFADRVQLNKSAVLFQNSLLNLVQPTLKEEGKYFDFNNIEIEPSKDVPIETVPSCTLDAALASVPDKRIDLLKINIGYNEMDILKHSSKLDRVQNICGEMYNPDETIIHETIEHLKLQGFEKSWFSKSDENSEIFIFSRGDSSDMFDLYNSKED
jgi:FkbM family methyltransferase